MNDDCPSDAKSPSSTTCRPAAGFCDVAENCDGTSSACPADAFKADGTSCDDGNSCTALDACQQGSCVGGSVSSTCADHYLCYSVKPAERPAPITGVNVTNELESGTLTVVKLRNLCTPADPNNIGVLDPNTHLETYQVTESPRPDRHQNLKLVNELGTLSLDTVKPDTLLVPTARSLTTSPPAPDPNAIHVDHFQCYRAKTSHGTPRFTPTIYSVTDEFTSPAKTFYLKKPKHLCVPVDQNGAGIPNADAHLVCYQAKPSSGQPRHQRVSGVQTNNELGPQVLTTVKEKEICVPSVLLAP